MCTATLSFLAVWCCLVCLIVFVTMTIKYFELELWNNLILTSRGSTMMNWWHLPYCRYDDALWPCGSHEAEGSGVGCVHNEDLVVTRDGHPNTLGSSGGGCTSVDHKEWRGSPVQGRAVAVLSPAYQSWEQRTQGLLREDVQKFLQNVSQWKQVYTLLIAFLVN